jgi:hypothetical protein
MRRGVQAEGGGGRGRREKQESLEEAKSRNGVRGASTLNERIKRRGREDALPKRMRAEDREGMDELRDAGGGARGQEAARADARIDYCLERAFLDIARGRQRMSAEGLLDFAWSGRRH